MNNKIRFLGLAVLIMVSPFLASADTLSMQLDPGMSGSQVSALQTFLATDSRIYPEALVTGFYGPLTTAAVKRYQTTFGISPVGRVGPATLASINGNSGKRSSLLRMRWRAIAARAAQMIRAHQSRPLSLSLQMQILR